MDKISRILSGTLDNIGYNSEIVGFRRRYWTQLATLAEGQIYGIKHNYVGSKAEGITAFFENDIDQMYLINGIICYETEQPLLQSRLIQFQTNTMTAPPGYTKLKLISRGKVPNIRQEVKTAVNESLFKTKAGEIKASSTLFLSSLNRRLRSSNEPYAVYYDSQGPATPVSKGYIMQDMVYALNCCNPNVLSSFKKRPRFNDWPPLHILRDESSAMCQLVPVGFKGSDTHWMEWRFCFIETEMKLTHSFNDTQLKMYILLKLIAKHILKEVSAEISSYIMKNVTYWISESLEENSFRDDRLIPLITLCLKFLQICIDRCNIPYYMIPERNLLAERLDPKTRCTLSALLSTLIQEGPCLFFRIPKLSKGISSMQMTPSALTEYRNKRELIEKTVMSCIFVDRCKLMGLYRGVEHYQIMIKTIVSVIPELRVVDMETIDSVFAIIKQEARTLNRQSYNDLPFKLLQELDVAVPQWRMVMSFLS